MDIYKVGDEAYAIWADYENHVSIYGIHLTGPEPRTIHEIAIEICTAGYIYAFNMAQLWIWIYDTQICSRRLVSNYQIMNYFHVATKDGGLKGNKYIRYRYNEYKTPKLLKSEEHDLSKEI